MTSIETMTAKAETEYTLAQPVAAEGGKQGHKCCGGCCDVRRAVIIVNIVHACLIGLSLMSILATKNMANTNTYDDDAVASVMEDFANQSIGLAVGVMCAQIVAALCGIAGGLKFSPPLTVVAAAAYTAMLVLNLLSLNIGGVVYHGCFLYPHVVFVQEIRKGIMSEQNYPNEKFSCCCV